MFNPEEEKRWNVSLFVVLLIAAIIYLSSVVSPPSLMDDTDAVEAQIAKTMLTAGDWVTARIDGVLYLEKSPLSWWLTNIGYEVFGFHDWAARLAFALTAIGLVWLTAAFGRWAFGGRGGFYAGLVMATCIGLWIFTRILIPDVMLTFFIALSMWAFLRVLDEDEQHATFWAGIFYVCLALGLMLKSLIGVLFPLAAGMLFLFFTGQLFSRPTWQRLRPFSGTVLVLLIAAPWHILATVRNPPYFAWTLKSMAGHYHGFLWFYFINEQLLRFLNLRYPRDYDTVPRVWFWLFHLVWLFPWSVYLPAVSRLSFKPVDRAGNGPAAGLVLDRVCAGLFYFFHHARVLLDALLSGICIAAGFGNGGRGTLDSRRHARLERGRGNSRDRLPFHSHCGAKCADSGRHHSSAQCPSQRIQVIPRPYGRSYGGLIRVFAGSADDRLRRFSPRRLWARQNQGLAAISPRISRRRPDDGHLFSGGSPGDGQVRSAPLVP